MRLPPGYSNCHPGKVCRLKKSLYGLRQSPRNWFEKLTIALRRYGFKQAHKDHTLFIFRRGADFLAILIYVDDILVTGNNFNLCASFKKYLHNCFQLKDLGPLKYFLGIECARSSTGLVLCQRKYALEILQEAGLTDCKPASTPFPPGHSLATSTSATIRDPNKYRRLVGRLIYLTITRSNLAYSVHLLS